MANLLLPLRRFFNLDGSSPDEDPPIRRVEMPMDPDNPEYTLSFSADQVSEYKQFFQEYGFVVIRDVLTPEDCQSTIDEIWTYIETSGFKGRNLPHNPHKKPVKRDDPSTWDNDWPSMASSGICGSKNVFTPCALMNRQNPKVYDVFANLLEEKDLMVNHDRFGLFRPTADEQGNIIHEEWRTVENVHLDMNPWIYTLPHGEGLNEFDVDTLDYSYPQDFIMENNHPGRLEDGKISVQGLINLADNRPEDGGFQIVPGFHKNFLQWTNKTRSTLGKCFSDRQSFIVLPKEDRVWSHAQRISSRAGSLLVWNQLMAHGSTPNASHRARYAQFIKFQKAVNLEGQRGMNRKRVIEAEVKHSGVQLTELGMKLFTQKSW